MVTSPRPLLFFIILSIERDWVRKKKIKVNFLMLFDKPLSKDLIFKEFIACNGCFRSGTSFWCAFSTWVFHKNVPCLTLNGQRAKLYYQRVRFQCHTFFPSQDIKKNVSLSSYLNNWWYKLWDLSSIILKSNHRQAKKRQRWKYKNLKRAFQMIFRSVFHNYLRTII